MKRITITLQDGLDKQFEKAKQTMSNITFLRISDSEAALALFTIGLGQYANPELPLTPNPKHK